MKKNIIKHLLIVGVLLGIFMLSISQLAVARKTPPPLKFILVTYCCEGGQVAGTSKDCIEGEGVCYESQCITGQETPFENCP